MSEMDEQEAAAEFIRMMKRLQAELDDVSTFLRGFGFSNSSSGLKLMPGRMPRMRGPDSQSLNSISLSSSLPPRRCHFLE